MVPTLLCDGLTMSQSLAIIDYLEEAYPSLPSLYPKTPKERYLVRSIAQTIACDIHPPQNVGILAKVGGSDMPKREEFARWVIEKGFDGLEKTLKETAGRCCVGDEVSVADLCLCPMAFNAVSFHCSRNPFRKLANSLSKFERLSTVSESKSRRNTRPSTNSTVT